MAKLYQDEEDLDEMKVFDMGSDHDQEVQEVDNKRKIKEQTKMSKPSKGKTSQVAASKIGRLVSILIVNTDILSIEILKGKSCTFRHT
jgi:hypothetical protein